MYVCVPRPLTGPCRLEKTDAWSPVSLGGGFGVHDDVVGERVGVGGCDGRDVVLVAVHNPNNLVSGFLEGLGHGAANFDDI